MKITTNEQIKDLKVIAYTYEPVKNQSDFFTVKDGLITKVNAEIKSFVFKTKFDINDNTKQVKLKSHTKTSIEQYITLAGARIYRIA